MQGWFAVMNLFPFQRFESQPAASSRMSRTLCVDVFASSLLPPSGDETQMPVPLAIVELCVTTSDWALRRMPTLLIPAPNFAVFDEITLLVPPLSKIPMSLLR